MQITLITFPEVCSQKVTLTTASEIAAVCALDIKGYYFRNCITPLCRMLLRILHFIVHLLSGKRCETGVIWCGRASINADQQHHDDSPHNNDVPAVCQAAALYCHLHQLINPSDALG